LVQAAQEPTNHAGVRQTKQFADDIRSQVAGRELAEMNELADGLRCWPDKQDAMP
jgi:hypothetical protein